MDAIWDQGTCLQLAPSVDLYGVNHCNKYELQTCQFTNYSTHRHWTTRLVSGTRLSGMFAGDNVERAEGDIGWEFDPQVPPRWGWSHLDSLLQGSVNSCLFFFLFPSNIIGLENFEDDMMCDLDGIWVFRARTTTLDSEPAPGRSCRRSHEPRWRMIFNSWNKAGSVFSKLPCILKGLAVVVNSTSSNKIGMNSPLVVW